MRTCSVSPDRLVCNRIGVDTLHRLRLDAGKQTREQACAGTVSSGSLVLLCYIAPYKRDILDSDSNQLNHRGA